MNTTYLEITYRHGQPVAAYLYLPRREGDRAQTSRRVGAFVADIAGDGRLIGVEFPSAHGIDLSALDELLREYHVPAVDRREFLPLVAA